MAFNFNFNFSSTASQCSYVIVFTTYWSGNVSMCFLDFYILIYLGFIIYELD